MIACHACAARERKARAFHDEAGTGGAPPGSFYVVEHDDDITHDHDDREDR